MAYRRRLACRRLRFGREPQSLSLSLSQVRFKLFTNAPRKPTCVRRAAKAGTNPRGQRAEDTLSGVGTSSSRSTASSVKDMKTRTDGELTVKESANVHVAYRAHRPHNRMFSDSIWRRSCTGQSRVTDSHTRSNDQINELWHCLRNVLRHDFVFPQDKNRCELALGYRHNPRESVCFAGSVLKHLEMHNIPLARASGQLENSLSGAKLVNSLGTPW